MGFFFFLFTLSIPKYILKAFLAEQSDGVHCVLIFEIISIA